MTTSNSSASDQINAFLATASADVLEILATDTGLRLLLDRAARLTGQPAPVGGFRLEAKTRIIAAINRADLLHREHYDGAPLKSLPRYEELRIAGEDPSRKMIYDHFGSWPNALLAACANRHLYAAKRRDRGGDRRNVQYTPQDCERFALRWSEQVSGGRLPTTGDWKLIVAANPDAPSLNQLLGRKANQSCQRSFTDFINACKHRALAEPELWPFTALAVKWENRL